MERGEAPGSFRQPSSKTSKMLRRQADPGALPHAWAKPSPVVASSGWPRWRKKGSMGAACKPAGFACAGSRGREPFRGEYLHLSHLRCMPGLGLCWVPTAQGSWQHVLAPRQGYILMLIDSKMPLSCSVREAVSKRSVFNVREEPSLKWLELQSSLLLHKKKERVKEEGKNKFSCPCAGPELLCLVACTCHTCTSRHVCAR